MNSTSTHSALAPQRQPSTATATDQHILLVAFMIVGILTLAFGYFDGVAGDSSHAYLLDDRMILQGDQSFRTVAPSVPHTLSTTFIGSR